MSIYAQLDEDNQVINSIILEKDSVDSELEWLGNIEGNWVLSYDSHKNEQVGKHPARVGMFWDSEKFSFIFPKPFESWVLDESELIWNAPIPKPDGVHIWDEEKMGWVKIDLALESD